MQENCKTVAWFRQTANWNMYVHDKYGWLSVMHGKQDPFLGVWRLIQLESIVQISFLSLLLISTRHCTVWSHFSLTTGSADNRNISSYICISQWNRLMLSPDIFDKSIPRPHKECKITQLLVCAVRHMLLPKMRMKGQQININCIMSI